MEPILHVKLLIALYGLLRSNLPFYKKLRKDLEDMGFEVNPYGPCEKRRKGALKFENALWVTSNAPTTDRKNPQEAPLRSLCGSSYSWRPSTRTRVEMWPPPKSKLFFFTQKTAKRP